MKVVVAQLFQVADAGVVYAPATSPTYLTTWHSTGSNQFG